VQTLGALFSVDDLTGFEITKFLELPQPYGILVVWGLVLPSIYVLATSLTNLVLKDGLILKVPTLKPYPSKFPSLATVVLRRHHPPAPPPPPYLIDFMPSATRPQRRRLKDGLHLATRLRLTERREAHK